MYFDLFDPILYVFKSLPLIDGVGKYYPHGSSIIGLSDSFELFLTCSIPNL